MLRGFDCMAVGNDVYDFHVSSSVFDFRRLRVLRSWNWQGVGFNSGHIIYLCFMMIISCARASQSKRVTRVRKETKHGY